LKETLTVARGLVINWEKFFQRRIEYLAHVIENTLISSPMEVKSVKRFLVSTIYSFLDFTGYFRKFIWDYARIAKPLSDILKEN